MFDQYFSQRQYQGSECSFTNVFMWRKRYNIQWVEVMDHLCIKAQKDYTPFILPPFGPNLAEQSKVVDFMIRYFKDNNMPFVMKGIYKDSMEALEANMPGVFNFSTDRDNYDYVYRGEDLRDLKGRKYHGKKNHVNAFRSANPNYQYLPLTQELIPDCIDFAIEWCKRRGCDTDYDLQMEKCAVLTALRNFFALDYKGGLIKINDKIEAFSFGELINPTMAVIHVEKANPDIKGLYTVINQEFCQRAWTDTEYINREEDMGLEGLRKAKESYRPVLMVEKYSAVLK